MNKGQYARDRALAVHGAIRTLGMIARPPKPGDTLSTTYQCLFEAMLDRYKLNPMTDAGLPTLHSGPSWVPRFDLAASKSWFFDECIYKPISSYPDRGNYKARVCGAFLETRGTFLDVITSGVTVLREHNNCTDTSCETALFNLEQLLAYVRKAILVIPNPDLLRLSLPAAIYAQPLRYTFPAGYENIQDWLIFLANDQSASVSACLRSLFEDKKALAAHQNVCSRLGGQRAIFRTMEGRLGTASIFVQEGDLIASIPSLSMPMILRPANEGFHQVIGASVFYDLMPGELHIHRHVHDYIMENVQDIVLC